MLSSLECIKDVIKNMRIKIDVSEDIINKINNILTPHDKETLIDIRTYQEDYFNFCILISQIKYGFIVVDSNDDLILIGTVDDFIIHHSTDTEKGRVYMRLFDWHNEVREPLLEDILNIDNKNIYAAYIEPPNNIIELSKFERVLFKIYAVLENTYGFKDIVAYPRTIYEQEHTQEHFEHTDIYDIIGEYPPERPQTP